jgi:hypothetical protein
MTNWINVGAYFDNGTSKARVASKAELDRHLRDNPGDVEFDNTAMHMGPGDAKYRASEIPGGLKFQVCGPDPYTNRKWWATVELVDGKPEVTS